MNLTVDAGEFIAIVGRSGNGKSTLINMVAGLIRPTSGTVSVAGRNVADLGDKALSVLRNRTIGFVTQSQTLLGNLTVLDNVILPATMFPEPLPFAQNAEATDAQVVQAAQIAQAEEFIEEKPEKYESPVSQGGTNVSGGQKQRLTIARALVSKPEILILDDSLSALDFATDAALRKAIGELEGNVTTFLVSQRISGIRQADKILVMEDGELAGQGTHEELMETCETYQEIYYSQFPEERPAAVKSSKETGKDLDKADKMTEKAEKGAAE